jgi:hypothetical protein
MNLWKDLLFLGGHIATEAGLAALGKHADEPATPAPREAEARDNPPSLPLPATR